MMQRCFSRRIGTFHQLTTNLAQCVSESVASGRTALIAPQQQVLYCYGDLDDRARRLATGLIELGYEPGAVIVSNIPNISENLILQLALSHIGGALATPRKGEDLQALTSKYNVLGAICCDDGSEAQEWAQGHRLPTISLGEQPPNDSPTVTFDELIACPPRREDPTSTGATLLGIFGSAMVTNGEAISLGRAAASRLGTQQTDRTCVSVTLCHAFGIGSAATSAFSSGGACVLPAVGGIRGCGDPQQ